MKYAVVREEHYMNFRTWHETYEEAEQEAERLCRKENVPFFILAAIGHCHIEEVPVKWEKYV